MDVLDEDLRSENLEKCRVVENFEEELSEDFYIQALQVEHSYSLSCADDKNKEIVG